MNAPAQAWNWPEQVPLPDVRHIVDAHVLRVLEYAPPAMRLEWQTRMLRALLQHTVARSPAWRTAVGAVAHQTTAERLDLLPVLDRASFRTRVEAEGALALPPSQGRTGPGSTSGSTGMPVRFFRGERTAELMGHFYGADNARHGRDMTRRWAALGPHIPPHPGASHTLAPAQPWLGRSAGLTRRGVDAPLAESAQWLATENPAYLFTNPTLLSALLDAWEQGQAPIPVGLEQVATFGATVEPPLRERTRRVTGASIRDRYSCEEAGVLALQCPHDEHRYHACAANVILEVVDDAGRPCPEGVPGRVLVTALHHWASPAIRYDVGDIAALHPQCSCGATVPTLSQLLGRKRGLLRTASGASRFVRMTATDWLNAAPVREHRIVQQDLASLRVELVLAAPLTPAQKEAVLQLLRERIDAELRYDIVELERIDWPAGAKRQDVVGLA